MSLLFSKRELDAVTADQLIPGRGAMGARSVAVTSSSALRASAVWACLRLRADLISTMPVDTFRRLSDGVQVQTPKPPVLVAPGGGTVSLVEWLYASQFDLDRHGNTVGIIRELDGQGLPKVIELQSMSRVVVRGVGSTITKWVIGGKEYEPREIWHEKQFTEAGVPLGLSPVSYATGSIGGYLSAQQFALDWFASSANPSGTLAHQTQEEISSKVADVMKDRFKVATANRDIFVTGTNWVYTPAEADASQAAFLEQMKYGVTDICRFFGVPGDMIDAEGGASSITYANITQRNLQLLVMNLGPAIVRREAALSRLLPQPRYVKFNTDAILRMDPQTRVATINSQVVARTLAPSEARELDNRQPFTDEQLAEFDRLFGTRAATPTTAPTPAQSGGTP
jgi:HK97 family phage portal protein